MNQAELGIEVAPFLLWLAFKGVVTRPEIDRKWSPTSIDEVVNALLRANLIREADEVLFLEDAGDAFLSDACRGALSDAEHIGFGAFVARFDPIDRAVKQAVTNWQSHRGAPGGLDEGALAAVDQWMDAHSALEETVSTSDPVVGRLLAPHLPALDRAVQRFLDGETDAFTGGDDESYHTLWFLMHELILRTAGIGR